MSVSEENVWRTKSRSNGIRLAARALRRDLVVTSRSFFFDDDIITTLIDRSKFNEVIRIIPSQ